MRRKNKWTCLAVIGSIIIITAIVVPITIIKTSEDNKIARNTTIETGANGTTPKPITKKQQRHQNQSQKKQQQHQNQSQQQQQQQQ